MLPDGLLSVLLRTESLFPQPAGVLLFTQVTRHEPTSVHFGSYVACSEVMNLSRELLAISLGVATLLRSAPQDAERKQPAAPAGPVAIGWEVLDKGLADSNERHRQQ